MSTYAELVEDVRSLVPEVARTNASDKSIARMVWRALKEIATEGAELSPAGARLPRTTSSISVPADLTTAMTLPTMIKPVEFEVVYSTGIRLPLTLVPPHARWDEIRPLPAAFIENGSLFAVPGTGGRTVWTHANINAGDWSDASTVECEYIPVEAAPAAMTTTITLDDLFHDYAIHSAAASVAMDKARIPLLVGLKQQKHDIALHSLSGHPTVTNVVRQVW